MTQLPMSAGSPQFLLTQIACRDDAERYCDSKSGEAIASIDDVNCMGPQFADRPCSRSEIEMVSTNTYVLKPDHPGRSASKFDSFFLSNTLRKSMTTITLVHAAIAIALVAITAGTLSRRRRVAYCFTFLLSWFCNEYVMVLASIAPIGLAWVSMFSALVLIDEYLERGKSHLDRVIIAILVLMHVSILSLRREDQALIFIAILLMIAGARGISSWRWKHHDIRFGSWLFQYIFGISIVTATILGWILSPWVRGGDSHLESYSNQILGRVKFIVPGTLSSPSQGTRLTSPVGTSNVINTFVEFAKSPFYYLINIGKQLIDLVWTTWNPTNQMFPIIAGAVVLIAFAGSVKYIGVNFVSKANRLEIGLVLFVICAVTLKGNLDGGTRSNFRYVFIPMQYMVFVWLKDQYAGDAIRTAKRVLNVFFALLIYHCICAWLYLRLANQMDFGYFILNGATTIFITIFALVLTGISCFAATTIIFRQPAQEG
jgi:hypothetical protein